MKRIETYWVYDWKSIQKPVVYFSTEEQASKLMNNFVFQNLIWREIDTQVEKTIIEIFDTFDEYNEVKILKEVQNDLAKLSEWEISLLESELIISTTQARVVLRKINETERFIWNISYYTIEETWDGLNYFDVVSFFSEEEAQKMLKKSLYYSLSETTIKIYKDYLKELKQKKIRNAVSKIENPDILRELGIIKK